jgi:hypothetical protein
LVLAERTLRKLFLSNFFSVLSSSSNIDLKKSRSYLLLSFSSINQVNCSFKCLLAPGSMCPLMEGF